MSAIRIHRRAGSSAPRRAASAVRIIGGAWRSRLVRFPGSPSLRPTPDRVRETLFNWLGQDLDGLACLDLFAGSGALGFEAASRGAARVVLVESQTEAAAALLTNARLLGGASVRVEACDALEVLRRETGGPFDVIFLDPPYKEGVSPDLLDRVSAQLAHAGRVYLESDRPCVPGPGWRVVRQSRAGRVCFHLLERERPAPRGEAGAAAPGL
ncbi:MAG: 16S rRNA (guanine(966)-N(2))-methyltransferase RsmD [Burkholderiales bacterium]|nr:16S rRNA (guanine(966)-N(2))-methyltransferase RsmD [Burkholderiales bacterium]